MLCDTCVNAGTASYKYPCNCCDMIEGSSRCKYKKVRTHADRIRAMSDEELTTFLNKIVVNHHIKDADNCNHCPLKGARPCDTEGIIDWLKQPAE